MGKKNNFTKFIKGIVAIKVWINSSVLWIMPLLLNLLDYEISSLPKKKKKKKKKEH